MRMFRIFSSAVGFLAITWLLVGPFVVHAAPDEETLKRLQALKSRIDNPEKSQDNIFSADLEKMLAKKKAQATGKEATATQQAAGGQSQALDDDPTTGMTEAEKQAELEKAVNERTFQEMLSKIMPMTPEQIQRLRMKQDEIDLASKGPVGTPPKPVAISYFVSLAPGDKLPVIRMQPGFVSSLVFVDSTGAPWPVQMYSLGDPTLFNVAWDKVSNILLMQANQNFHHGNIAVLLKGMNTPVMITLVPGQSVVDYRIDMRVQGLGPNAISVKLTDGLPTKKNDMLLALLDGVTPEKSQEVEVKGGNAHAWVHNKKLFLRTRMTLISPGWISSMSSPDGMHVYEIMRTPLVLVSDHGQIVQLKIEGL